MEVEETTKRLAEKAAKDLYENLTAAKAFVLEQAPDVFRQRPR